MNKFLLPTIVSVTLGFSAIAIAGGHASPKPATQQQAEETAAMQMQISMTQAKRQAVIAENLRVPPETADAFWDLYRNYSNDRAKLAEADWKLLVRFRDNFGSMSEDDARSILNEALSLEQKYTTLKKRYLPKFRRVLSEKQTLTYFQLENKMDAIMDFELAEVVPLAE